MHLANDIKNEVRAAKKVRLPWWGVLSWMAFCLPVIWLFDQFGRLEYGVANIELHYGIGFRDRFKMEPETAIWFRTAMAIIAALHAPLIVFVPWTSSWAPAMAIAAIDSADLIVVLAILSVVRKSMERPNTFET